MFTGIICSGGNDASEKSANLQNKLVVVYMIRKLIFFNTPRRDYSRKLPLEEFTTHTNKSESERAVLNQSIPKEHKKSLEISKKKYK